jgi:3-oxoacyl-[acyl-carrier protein] reductase
MSLRQRAYRFADGASALAGLGGPVDHHGKVLLAAGPECCGPHVASPRSVAAGSPHRQCLSRRHAPWDRSSGVTGSQLMDGPFSGRVALITGASGGTGRAPARRPASGGAVPGLGYSAHGQAAQALAAEITRPAAPRPRPAPARAARRPPVSSSRRPPKRRARRTCCAGQQRQAEPSPAVAGHHRHPARSDAGGEPARPVPARPARGGLHAGTGVQPDLAHLPGRRVHRRRRRPASCASKARLHATDPLPASRLAATGITVNALAPALAAETRMLPGDPAQLRGRCRPAIPGRRPRRGHPRQGLPDQPGHLPDGGICPRQAPDGIHHGQTSLAGLPLTSALP